MYLADKGTVELDTDELAFYYQDVKQLREYDTALLADGELRFSALDNTLSVRGLSKLIREPHDIGFGTNARDFVLATEVTIKENSDDSILFEALFPSWMLLNANLTDIVDRNENGIWQGFEDFFAIDSPEFDQDGDGYSNLEESLAFTNPNDTDDSPVEWLVTSRDYPDDRIINVDGTISPYYAYALDDLSLTIDLNSSIDDWQWQSANSDWGCELVENKQQLHCATIPATEFSLFENEPKAPGSVDLSYRINIGILEWVGEYNTEKPRQFEAHWTSTSGLKVVDSTTF
ncbi:hypothetical protein [Vibrio sp. WXL210]|uniref:hypothetical protein n=1 Tax=Vibrio sp. WXL210 TaxID=3450709 RepID=UPI003EC56200